MRLVGTIIHGTVYPLFFGLWLWNVVKGPGFWLQKFNDCTFLL
jgi:hypothetical protein